MSRSFLKIWNIFTSILVGLVVILALLLAGVRIAGLQVFSVLSGSMEPTYHVGALIYVKKVDAMELRSGDVITFMLDEDTVATHRIVEVVPDAEDSSVLRFRTKGDANDNVDGSLVHYKNVLGKPVFTIPLLGYLAGYIQHPPGTYVAISVGAILLLLVFLPDLFAPEEKGPSRPRKRSRKAYDSPGPAPEPPQAEPALPRPERAAPGRHSAAPAKRQLSHRGESRPTDSSRRRRGRHEA